MTTVPAASATRPPRGHAVQFYDRDDFLCEVVTDYLAESLLAGEPAVVFATEEHRRSLTAALADRGADMRLLILRDARATLDLFLPGELPDGDRFREIVGGMLDGLIRERQPRRIRAYGEMVDLAWRDGKPAAAIRLEELWNELGADYSFELLCAYSMQTFERSDDAELFADVCRTHDVVVPTERFTRAEEDARLREVSALQQRAAALEAEIARRKELEEERAFLLDLTTALHSSLDYDTRIRIMANLAVPRLADACAVDLVRDDGTYDRVTNDGASSDLALSIVRTDGVDPIARVLWSGEPEIVDNHRLVIPLRISDRTLGTLTFVRARQYTDSDLPLACEVARRAAMAIENARLYELTHAASLAKDQFLATLSHELRTPLTAILGWSRMLLLGELDPETHRTAVETIERSARTQAALIDDLLDLSRIVSGKLLIQRELVDVGAVITNAIQTVAMAAEAKNIRVMVEGIEERTLVNGDSTRLQQIVWNLLANAIKFSEPDSPILVRLEREDGEARIVVTDRGRGIRPDFLPNVFDPFRQADGAITRVYGGLGLGLAIVRHLTELHGGSVTAASEGEGRGATFTVTLPLALRRTSLGEVLHREEPIDLSGLSVLLVNDDSGTRDLLTAMLRRCGAAVQISATVDDACGYLQENRPHVVVADLGDDAPALLAATHGIPAIALTAEVTAAERTHPGKFHAYVEKPVDPFAFARLIRDLPSC